MNLIDDFNIYKINAKSGINVVDNLELIFNIFCDIISYGQKIMSFVI